MLVRLAFMCMSRSVHREDGMGCRVPIVKILSFRRGYICIGSLEHHRHAFEQGHRNVDVHLTAQRLLSSKWRGMSCIGLASMCPVVGIPVLVYKDAEFHSPRHGRQPATDVGPMTSFSRLDRLPPLYIVQHDCGGGGVSTSSISSSEDCT
jgi:hypothetical protein